MMLYTVLRALARVAVRWYYRDVSVRGLERVPLDVPLLVAVNHPNALVDVLVVGSVLPRRLTITAKSTLFANALAARLLRAAGVLPLQRASDLRQRAGIGMVAGGAGGSCSADAASEDSSTGGPPSLRPGQAPAPGPARNAETFRAVVDELARGGTVLIFPEGKSHDDPRLAPLRTGAARMALAALADGRAADVTILPVGLTFERKEALRSRVHVEIGAPIPVRGWRPASAEAAAELTALVAERLAAVTLNYDHEDEARRVQRLAHFFAAAADEPRAVSHDRPLDADVALARRIIRARTLLAAAGRGIVERAAHLLARVDALGAALDAHAIAIDDLGISTRGRPGLRFALREGSLWLASAPVVLWGRLHHWLPFRAARLAAHGSGASRDQPAMRTIVAGLTLVLIWYAVLGALVWRGFGPLAAALYLLALPLAADADLRLRDRRRRARRRVRAYLALRRDPTLRRRLVAELDWIRGEAAVLERELRTGVTA